MANGRNLMISLIAVICFVGMVTVFFQQNFKQPGRAGVNEESTTQDRKEEGSTRAGKRRRHLSESANDSGQEVDSLAAILRLLDLRLESKLETPTGQSVSEYSKNNRKDPIKPDKEENNAKGRTEEIKEIYDTGKGGRKPMWVHTARDNQGNFQKRTTRRHSQSRIINQEVLSIKSNLCGAGARGFSIILKIDRTKKSTNSTLKYDQEKTFRLEIMTIFHGIKNDFMYELSTKDTNRLINITVNDRADCDCFTAGKCRKTESQKATKPKVFLSARRVKAIAGQPVTVQCNVTGYPRPQIKWKRLGIIQSVEQTLSADKHSLIMTHRNPHFGAGGHYICIAKNKAGEDRKSVSLHFAEKDCSAWKALGYDENGVYRISPDGETHFEVYCDMMTNKRGWTVIQRRNSGTVDFYRNWFDYKIGFGNITGEFWLGNDKIHRLVKQDDMMVRFDLEDSQGRKAYAEYQAFYIGDESNHYMLHTDWYNGTAGDSLTYHNGMEFSTKDNNNDLYGMGCAKVFRGAWWYRACLRSNLNGAYSKDAKFSHSAEGIKWMTFNHDESTLIKTEVKIAPSLI